MSNGTVHSVEAGIIQSPRLKDKPAICMGCGYPNVDGLMPFRGSPESMIRRPPW